MPEVQSVGRKRQYMIAVFIVLTVLVIIVDVAVNRAGAMADERMGEIMHNEQYSKEHESSRTEAESI